jgi:hypothetical protein
MVRWAAARSYRKDPSRAAVRAEEWVGLIDLRPGKLFKLAVPAGLAGCQLAALLSPHASSAYSSTGWSG